LEPLLQQVLGQFPKEVKVVQKNFPLSMHKFSRAAALAALAAGDQGKYWEYHEKLFQNYNTLSDSKFLEIAQEIGLDMDAFKKSLADPRHQAELARDIEDGRMAGVTGTPTIFVGGRKLNNRSLEGFKALIDAELKTKKK